MKKFIFFMTLIFTSQLFASPLERSKDISRLLINNYRELTDELGYYYSRLVKFESQEVKKGVYKHSLIFSSSYRSSNEAAIVDITEDFTATWSDGPIKYKIKKKYQEDLNTTTELSVEPEVQEIAQILIEKYDVTNTLFSLGIDRLIKIEKNQTEGKTQFDISFTRFCMCTFLSAYIKVVKDKDTFEFEMLIKED